MSARRQLAHASDTSAELLKPTNGFSDGTVSELRWWNIRPVDDAPDRGVVGIVRVDDRVALVSLNSAVSDPAVTTRVDGLLTLAGLRLV